MKCRYCDRVGFIVTGELFYRCINSKCKNFRQAIKKQARSGLFRRSFEDDV